MEDTLDKVKYAAEILWTALVLWFAAWAIPWFLLEAMETYSSLPIK